MVLWVRQGAVRVADHRLSRFGRIREAAEALMASSTAPSAPPSWVLMVHSSSPSTSERMVRRRRSPGRSSRSAFVQSSGRKTDFRHPTAISVSQSQPVTSELPRIRKYAGGALGGGVALVIATGIERREHTLIFNIHTVFPFMSAGNFQDQLVNIHRNSIGELWQVPLTGKDQQESVLVQRNRIFRRTQVHGRILICTNFRLI